MKRLQKSNKEKKRLIGVGITISPDVAQALDDEAKRLGIKRSELCRRIFDMYLSLPIEE